MNKTLLVITTDKLSEFVSMGSLADRFYNADNYFDKVHILMLNNDKPAPKSIQKSVGTAELHLHNLEINKKWIMFVTLFWRPILFKLFIKPALKLAGKINPDLIHCQGGIFPGFLSAIIKENYNIPYLVTLHCTESESRFSLIGKTIKVLRAPVFYYGLKNANLVIAIYKSIITQLKNIGVTNYKTCYLPADTSGLIPKESYKLHSPIRIITAGRQITGKVPDKIIEAIATIDNVELTLVGRGTKHEYLKSVAKKFGVEEKVKFIPRLPIEVLCKTLSESDIFVAHNDYWGISRVAIEAILTGLPIVHNICSFLPVAEFDDCSSIIQVENEAESYRNAILKLINDDDFREKAGKETLDYGWEHWSPEICEKRIVEIYDSLLKTRD